MYHQVYSYFRLNYNPWLSDVALDLAQRYPNLALLYNGNGSSALSTIAQTNTLFTSTERFSRWQKLFYHCKYTNPPTTKPHLTFVRQNPSETKTDAFMEYNVNWWCSPSMKYNIVLGIGGQIRIYIFGQNNTLNFTRLACDTC